MDFSLRAFFISFVAFSVTSLRLAKLSFLILDIILNEKITSVIKNKKRIIIKVLKITGGMLLIILKKNGLNTYTKITPNIPKQRDVVKLTRPFIWNL